MAQFANLVQNIFKHMKIALSVEMICIPHQTEPCQMAQNSCYATNVTPSTFMFVTAVDIDEKHSRLLYKESHCVSFVRQR
jgi:hypothetical protein